MVASYHFPGAFNITGVNGYVPFVSFDPSADGVPYAPVLHYTDAISVMPSPSSDVTVYSSYPCIGYFPSISAANE